MNFIKKVGYYFFPTVAKYKDLTNIICFFFKKARIPDYLYIDLTSICNSNCIFCAYQYDGREKEIIDDRLFRRAIDEYKDMGGEKIGLTPILGEALIDPDILEKLEYIKNKKFRHVHFYTNLTLLHKFDIERFLRSGVTNLHISSAPFDKNIYEEIYRTANYTMFLDNLKNLLKSASNLYDKTIKEITIQFRSDKSLEKCISTPDFKKQIEPLLGPDISVSALSTFDSWNGAINKNDLLKGMSIKNANFLKILPCSRIFIVQVMVNGDIRLCGCRYDPYNRNDKLFIGNLKETTLFQAYNSRKVLEIAKSFIFNKSPEVCRRCSWYE